VADRRKSILAPLAALPYGRIVKLMGDGVLIEFATPSMRSSVRSRYSGKWLQANIGLQADRSRALRMGIGCGCGEPSV